MTEPVVASRAVRCGICGGGHDAYSAVCPPLVHPTILRRAVLLCSDSAPERAVQCDDDGRCPVHDNTACALWYLPWADAKRAASDGAS